MRRPLRPCHAWAAAVSRDGHERAHAATYGAYTSPCVVPHVGMSSSRHGMRSLQSSLRLRACRSYTSDRTYVAHSQHIRQGSPCVYLHPCISHRTPVYQARTICPIAGRSVFCPGLNCTNPLTSYLIPHIDTSLGVTRRCSQLCHIKPSWLTTSRRPHDGFVHTIRMSALLMGIEEPFTKHELGILTACTFYYVCTTSTV